MRPTNTEIKRKLKICILDIETTSLRGDYGGMIICAVLRSYPSGKSWSIRIDDPENPDVRSDKWIVKKLVEKINEQDMLVTWNGSMFDLRFIDTRCYKHKLPLMKAIFHRDILYHARSKLMIRSRRLNVVHDFLFGGSNKTSLTEQVWEGMLCREKWAISYMVSHCIIDCRETANIYEVFLPNLSEKLRKRGS